MSTRNENAGVANRISDAIVDLILAEQANGTAPIAIAAGLCLGVLCVLEGTNKPVEAVNLKRAAEAALESMTSAMNRLPAR